jgi:hydrogenase maturation protease
MAALLIGFGNQGRGDDGLGPLFAERIGRASPPGLSIDIDYQLTVDHALAVSAADLVVFADAAIGAEGSFSFVTVEATGAAGMGSHQLSPQAVLTLAKTLYGCEPRAFMLGIAGWDYGEVKEGLSAEATAHLDEAEAFFLDWYAGIAADHAPADGRQAAERLTDA